MVAEDEDRRRVKSMIMLQGVQGDKTLSSEEKTLFAETLREVRSILGRREPQTATNCLRKNKNKKLYKKSFD